MAAPKPTAKKPHDASTCPTCAPYVLSAAYQRGARFDSNGHARIGTRTVAEYRAERVLTGRHPAISAWSVLT